jgi:hypothetical protein
MSNKISALSRPVDVTIIPMPGLKKKNVELLFSKFIGILDCKM